MIEVIVLLTVVGVVLFLVNQYVPMAPPFKIVINVLVVLCLCIWLLEVFGVTHLRLHLR